MKMVSQSSLIWKEEQPYCLELRGLNRGHFLLCLQILHRMGSPEEMGKACLFLATDATFCTGAELMCTGGADIGIGIKNIEDNPYIQFECISYTHEYRGPVSSMNIREHGKPYKSEVNNTPYISSFMPLKLKLRDYMVYKNDLPSYRVLILPPITV